MPRRKKKKVSISILKKIRDEKENRLCLFKFQKRIKDKESINY